MVTALKPQPPQLGAREGVLLRNISWATFEALIDELESQPSKRLTYDAGLLEIWMPQLPHERYKKLLARLIDVVTEEREIEISSLGSCTWKRPDLAKGVEADECYYVQNEPAICGRMDLDLAIDPPPDLAIEIDITSLSLPRLPIYAALGVPEVWRFDGAQLTFLNLRGDEYAVMPSSLALPDLTSDDVTGLLNQAQDMGEISWAKLVRRWAQEKLG